jgi:hypothetical protein
VALRLWAEQRDADAVAAAREAITAYQRAAATPGTTNILQIAGWLTQLSGELAAEDRLADATAAQRAVVEVLRAHTPTETELVAHRLAVALAHHHVALRLWAEQRDTEAVAAAREAITAYQRAAATPGTTNILQIAGLLTQLSGELATHNQLADAISAAAESRSIHFARGDDAGLEAALANLTGLFARAPELRIMRAAIVSADASLLQSVMQEHGQNITSEGGIRRGADGVPRVECYASNETLDLLRAKGITVEIFADATAIGLSRRDVNVHENRFADGTVPPGVGELI